MKKVLAIVGPTASGKTKLSVEIAKRLNGEIISADSRQVYKHIPIVTAQPSIDEQKEIRHYFINELNLEDEFNAGEFGIKGREIIEDIFGRNKQPMIAGGSGLYTQSLIEGFFDEGIKSKEVRNDLYKKLDANGEKYLYDELKKVDKAAHTLIPLGKIRRVIRALEIYYTSGKKISDLHKEKTKVNFHTIQIGLSLDRSYLYERINNRVEDMVRDGLLEEVKLLKEKGYHYKTHYSVDTVGIKEVFKYFEGEYEYDEMVRLIKQNSRRYAKRQMTWFRKNKRINWVNVMDKETDDAVEEIIELFKKQSE